MKRKSDLRLSPKKIIFTVGTVALVSLALFFLINNDFWRIEKVNCQLNGDLCPANLWGELISQFTGRNFLFLSSSKLIHRVQEKHPEFSEVEVKKSFPDSLQIQITYRKPIAALAKEVAVSDSEASSKPEFLLDSEFYLVDEEGFCLGKKSETNLPVILLTKEPDLTPGQKLEEEIILQALKILKEAALRLLEPKVIRLVSQHQVDMWCRGGIKVLFSLEKDLQAQLDSLQFILNRAKIDGKKLKQVDLRFDKPVILE